MSRKNLHRLKLLFYGLLLIVSLLVQTSVFGTLHVMRAPCLLPVAVVCIALFEGAETGGAFGLVAGCLWCWSGRLSVFGVYSLLCLTVCGIAAGIIAQQYLAKNMQTALCLSAGAVLVTDGVFEGMRVLLYQQPAMSLVTLFLPQLLFSLGVCVIYFPLTACISRIGGFHG